MNEGEPRRFLVLLPDLTSTIPTDLDLDIHLAARALVEASFDWVWLAQPLSNRCIYLGRAPILGYSPRELEDVGVSGWVELVHPEDRIKLEERDRQALAEPGPLVVEYRVQRADGGWAFVEAKTIVVPSASAGKPIFVGAARDVTTERESLRATRRSQA